METIMAEVINGYERVINGRESGSDYLFKVVETYGITDDELIYLVYMAADIAMRRPAPDQV